MNKIAGEFQGERISATRRLEDRLRVDLGGLEEESRRLAAAGSNSEAREAFNTLRKAALKLRGEVVIQREVAGMMMDATSAVEREFPVPAAL